MNLRHFCRKTAGFLLTAAILMGGTITAYAKPDWPSDVGILADSGILMDMDSGTVIFGQQIHQTFRERKVFFYGLLSIRHIGVLVVLPAAVNVGFKNIVWHNVYSLN